MIYNSYRIDCVELWWYSLIVCAVNRSLLQQPTRACRAYLKYLDHQNTVRTVHDPKSVRAATLTPESRASSSNWNMRKSLDGHNLLQRHLLSALSRKEFDNAPRFQVRSDSSWYLHEAARARIDMRQEQDISYKWVTTIWAAVEDKRILIRRSLNRPRISSDSKHFC